MPDPTPRPRAGLVSFTAQQGALTPLAVLAGHYFARFDPEAPAEVSAAVGALVLLVGNVLVAVIRDKLYARGQGPPSPPAFGALVLTVLLLAGCRATVGGFGDPIEGAGDSDQDVIECQGECEVSQDPATGAWTVKSLSPDARVRWVTNSQVNAQRDVELVKATGALVLEAATKAGTLAATGGAAGVVP